MSDFLERLKTEKNELQEKLIKLESFIVSAKFDDLAPVQQSLLKIQLYSMSTYSNCLNERIKWPEE